MLSTPYSTTQAWLLICDAVEKNTHLLTYRLTFGGECNETNVERMTVHCLLTSNVDLDLAEVQRVIHRKLHNKVSSTRHGASTLEIDGGSVTDDARILSTHVVVPQGRRCDVRRHVRQSNDEVIRAKAWNGKNVFKWRSNCMYDVADFLVTS